MSRTTHRVLSVIAALGVAIAFVFGTTFWWYVYRPLPKLDGKVKVAGLQSAVTVERDGWGVPHIKANSEEDMAEAQGYVVAQDRLWQMDLLRRAARGQLSEVLGEPTVEIDKDFRTLNFSRTAQREVETMEPRQRKLMEAYARGVNKFIEQHQDRLPIEFKLLKYGPKPWEPSDSLVILGYMYRTLADTREEEMHRAVVTEKAGPELAKDLFREQAAMDHFVVGDPDADRLANQNAQAGQGDEEDDDDEMEYDDILKARKDAVALPAAANAPDLTAYLAGNVADWLHATQRGIRRGLGSNNWVVSGEHTATGKPLLANDTHLELTIPPIWYEVHLTAPGWNVKGFTLPGSPLVIIGHNDRVAWGFTNNGADVLDIYQEIFNPANADEYRVSGKWKKADVYDEVIHVKGAADEHMRLVVTRHGPVIAHEGDKTNAMRWTALEPGALANSYTMLGQAQNWNEFLGAIKQAWGPAQNCVYADVEGNIGYVMSARVPVRKKGHGEVPVPGDTDEYEWTGYIPFEQLPQILNPASGLIVTANARVVGPDYKPYLTDRWEEPYRTARIWDLLHDKTGLRPEDLLKVQADTYSYPHVFMAEQLADARKTAAPKDARTKSLIEKAKDWNGIADANSTVVPFLHRTQHEALVAILEPKLGKDWDKYDWREMAFLQWVLTERPSRWLPTEYKSYDDLLIAAADRATKSLEESTKSTDPDAWTWKRFNSLDMLHPIGREGVLKKMLSLGDEPQAGTMWSPRAATKHHGPAMRFVANPANWDESILLIPAGQSGQPGSEHYTDQFRYWFEGKPIYAPFSDAAEAKAKEHTLTLEPAN